MTQELRQIHQVRTVETWRYVEDEYGQMQKKPVQRFIKSDTERIAHPEAGTFEVQPDGSFHLPVDVAAFLLRQPDWHEGPNPFHAEVEESEQKPRASRARRPVAADA